VVHKGSGWIDMDWINLTEIRSLWQADVSMEMKFLISNLCLVVNVVFSLLGDSPASAFYVPTFRNTLFHCHGSCEPEE
jgi:hypothetical protein